MGFKYREQNGTEYASYARSVRKGDRVVTEYTYLGRVIDREQGLFYNRKLGYIAFDTEERKIVPAPRCILPEDGLEEESAILDFGDTFFVDSYMRSRGIMRCFESMGCTETDMLCTVVAYYVLTHRKAARMRRWYEGNYVGRLYPGLDLRPGKLVEFAK